MNLAAIQAGTIAMMCAKTGASEESVVKSKAFNDWMNWLEMCAEPKVDPVTIPKLDSGDLPFVTRLCARCGLNFTAGWEHAPAIRPPFCPECVEKRAV